MPTDTNLFQELDEAIAILTIARAQRSMTFIKGVVRYVKAMAPNDVKQTLAEIRGD